MMGRLSGAQVQLFYAFRLEDRVPSSHLLRQIDAVLDLGDLRRLLAPFYSHTGRPSVDPELMMRMLIIGYCFGIRSERRLCEDVSLNLAYRWFCRLGLEDQTCDGDRNQKQRADREGGVVSQRRRHAGRQIGAPAFHRLAEQLPRRSDRSG